MIALPDFRMSVEEYLAWEATQENATSIGMGKLWRGVAQRATTTGFLGTCLSFLMMLLAIADIYRQVQFEAEVSEA